MQVRPTALPEVLLVEPRVFGDERGYFLETWHGPRYEAAGLPGRFVQDNLSYSARGVLRGLHFQLPPHAQGKLVYALQGEVFDVAVDVRRGSPTFGRWVGAHLSGENKRQLYIPEGFAHGFYVVSEQALFAYKCTDVYDAACERGVLWSDPAIGIQWPNDSPTLSEKDGAAPLLGALAPDDLPRYAG